MRAYLSPIGYDSSRVTRTVISNGIESDDRVVLLRPALEMDDNRAAQAVRDVRQMLAQVEPNATVDLHSVPHDNYEQAVRRICDVIEDIEGDIVVNLSGGARDVYLALATATFVYHDRIKQYLSYSDIDGDVRSIRLPKLIVDTPAASFETLAVIEEHDTPMSISELTEIRDIAKSTITRHLQQLEGRQLVETWQDGKVKYAAITFTGHLLVRAKS